MTELTRDDFFIDDSDDMVEDGKILIRIHSNGQTHKSNLLVKEIIESLDSNERLNIQRDINSRQTVAIQKLTSENEDLQMKLDGDAMTFMELQKKILYLEQMKQIAESELHQAKTYRAKHRGQTFNQGDANAELVIGILEKILKEVPK